MECPDADYVDAYYGPEEWKPTGRDAVKQEKFPFADFDKEVQSLLNSLNTTETTRLSPIEKLRHASMVKQLIAVRCRIILLSGKKLLFDEESQQTYDAVAPTFPESRYKELLDELGRLLPGRERSLTGWNSTNNCS